MRIVWGLFALWIATSPACAGELIEPHMRISVDVGAPPQVALTLDACSGGVDMRVLKALIENRIPATLFLTGKWLTSNPEAAKLLGLHRDLFEFENHGAEHVPPVIGSERPYGLMPAGTSEAVMAEVQGGSFFIRSVMKAEPKWYRGATALYSTDAIEMIESAGLRIGGFSLNGDFGASGSAEAVKKSISGAYSGDVIIAHMNQPSRPAGEGVVEGILALKQRGFRFVRLDQVPIVFD